MAGGDFGDAGADIIDMREVALAERGGGEKGVEGSAFALPLRLSASM